MIKLFGYKKCSTCRKAENFFKEHDVRFSFIDITENPPNANELKKILKASGKNIKKLLNTSGVMYRELNLKNKIDSMDENEILSLLAQNGKLIKRPIVFDSLNATIGFSLEDFQNTWE